jgi:hypothetical protein
MSNNDAPSNDEGEQQNEPLLDSPSCHCLRDGSHRFAQPIRMLVLGDTVTASARRIDASHVSVPACIKFTTSSWLCLVVDPLPHILAKVGRDCQVLNVIPHDETAFTQGLLIHEGNFVEGTGNHGESVVRIYDMQDGTFTSKCLWMRNALEKESHPLLLLLRALLLPPPTLQMTVPRV